MQHVGIKFRKGQELPIVRTGCYSIYTLDMMRSDTNTIDAHFHISEAFFRGCLEYLYKDRRMLCFNAIGPEFDPSLLRLKVQYKALNQICIVGGQTIFHAEVTL
jgi:hypothetical protein